VKGVDGRFTAYQMRWTAINFLHKSRGTTVSGITKKQLNETVFFLPPSNEQIRIADALDELLSDLDAAVAVLEQVRDKLKVYRAAVLKAAVEGALTAAWRRQNPEIEPTSELLKRILAERRRRWEEEQLRKFKEKGREPPKNWKAKYKEPAAPDAADLPPLPDEWCWATVEQVGEVRLGRQRAPQHHRGDHMRPYLRVANVYEDRLDLSDVKTMNFTPAEFATYALRHGDILLNEGQSPEFVGRPAMFRGEIPGCCYQKTLIRFRSSNGLASAFALIVFRAYLHSGRFRRSANITTNIAHLVAERFEPIEFPLPPLEEQEAIVESAEDQLSVIDHLESGLDAKLKNAQALRQSILRHAFSGKLVPQDPNDEPASELLDRIAVERGLRTRESAVRRLNGRKPRRSSKARGKAARAATKEAQHGRIADR
jgi:type I restriction enzyme S subunit